jgi:hypothetical protein
MNLNRFRCTTNICGTFFIFILFSASCKLHDKKMISGKAIPSDMVIQCIFPSLTQDIVATVGMK